ncbi:MAG: sugar-binding protein [Lentisphaeria bacterium]|jgi:hypothetical protein
MRRIATLIVMALAVALSAARAQAQGLGAGFESGERLPAGWRRQGDVVVDRQAAFKGRHSALLQRAPEAVDKPCAVTSAEFAVTPGTWEFALACKSDLQSPDDSFSGTVALEWLDGAGQVLESVKLADLVGQRNWLPVRKRLEAPEQAAAARFHAQLNKASGRFWIDELAAAFVSPVAKKGRRIDRIMFDTAQMGNLLFPEDRRTVAVTVVATKPLEESQLQLAWEVRDYWGAECSPVGTVKLGGGKPQGKNIVYQATIDLGALPLEGGRYYELHAAVPQPGAEPFRNYTSLAILPPPVTKQYKPEEIPFTSRNWDGRVADFFCLADRLGVRISNIWSGWASAPPYNPTAACIEVCGKLGMGALSSTQAHAIEHHLPGWEKYDEKALRAGVREWIAKYGKVRPLYFTLGNEPPVLAERIPADVAAYKALYEEIKKVDPGIFVVGSSVGPVEAFFKAGYHKYCDAVDFHGYTDWQEVPLIFQEYERLFAQYGDRKPVWCTEIGLSCQGLARQAVARAVVKKVTSFFARGGANISWFCLGYPDPDAKLVEDSTTAGNLFDCRYAPRYCPKLDAIAYYNMINGICVKKPVGQKLYGPDIHAFLFRDRENHCLQVLWKEKGRRDAMLPLPGVGKVTAIDIDGRRSELDAGGQGLTLTINEDPILLLYDSAAAPLAERLGAPAARVAALPEGIVKGGSGMLQVALAKGLSPAAVELATPAFWQARRGGAGGEVAFTVTAPAGSVAREGALVVKIKDGKGGHCGELRALIPVTGRLVARLLPEPGMGGQPPAVRLRIENHAAERQEVGWKLALTGEMAMAKGRFKLPVAATAYFADAAEGRTSVAGGAAAEIVVPLAGVNPLDVYRVKGSVTDAEGRTVADERFMAGFVRVPRAKAALTLDGSLDEAAWQAAPAAGISEARQYFAYGREAKDRKEWKGTNDLSATLRFLWDEKCLYVGVQVRDDVFANTKVDGELWAGDGLQFLVDPARAQATKVGKYDLGMALTRKGPQAWCFMSADAAAPLGETKDILVAAKPGAGGIAYEIAIPWSRLAPFKPAAGANLGLCMVLNEDDGAGRQAFMGWFGDVESKQVDTIGDLILAP